MTDFTTVGRPYAQAAFEYATEKNALDDWQAMLSALAVCVAHPEVEQLLKNPSYQTAQYVELCSALVSKKLDASQENFIKLLAENARLFALPAIYDLFMAFRAEAEKILPVMVKSAMPLDDGDIKKLGTFLAEKFNRSVTLEIEIDESLIGGVLIRAGDHVIDGSVRGQLEKLKKAMAD
jgi:F-type H+-transporting ATPase subunit delta